jgi:hypothetical protein
MNNTRIIASVWVDVGLQKGVDGVWRWVLKVKENQGRRTRGCQPCLTQQTKVAIGLAIGWVTRDK